MKTKTAATKCASKGILSNNRGLKKNMKTVKTYSNLHNLPASNSMTQNIVTGRKDILIFRMGPLQ